MIRTLTKPLEDRVTHKHAWARSEAMMSADSAAPCCDAERLRMLRSRRGLGAVMKLCSRLQAPHEPACFT